MIYEVLKPIPAKFNQYGLKVGDVFKYGDSSRRTGMVLELVDGRTIEVELGIMRFYIQINCIGPASATAQVLYGTK